MKFIIRTIVLVTLLNFAGCSNSNIRQHPQITTELKNINTVVIAPPAISIEQHNFDGETEKLAELEESIRNELLSIANTKLNEKGFEVISFNFDEAINQDEEFAYTINQIREGYKEARKALYLDGEGSADEQQAKNLDIFRANVGTAINLIAEKTGADSLLLINYSGAKKSGGNMAKDIAMSVVLALLTGYAPVSNAEASYIEVALIDSNSGNVLWSNIGNGTQVNSNIANSVLHDMPLDVD